MRSPRDGKSWAPPCFRCTHGAARVGKGSPCLSLCWSMQPLRHGNFNSRLRATCLMQALSCLCDFAGCSFSPTPCSHVLSRYLPCVCSPAICSACALVLLDLHVIARYLLCMCSPANHSACASHYLLCMCCRSTCSSCPLVQLACMYSRATCSACALPLLALHVLSFSLFCMPSCICPLPLRLLGVALLFSPIVPLVKSALGPWSHCETSHSVGG